MSSVNIKTTPLNFAKQLAAFKSFKDAFPRFVGNLAVSFFKDSFRRQGFIDNGGVEKWPARKPSWNKKNSKGRAILVKLGRLRRSVRVIRTGLGYVVVGSDVPYARIHNEGGTIRTTQSVGSYNRKGYKRKSYTRTWKGKSQKIKASTVQASTVGAHKRKMNIEIKQRQFIGQSAFLNKRILMNAEYKLKQILNS